MNIMNDLIGRKCKYYGDLGTHEEGIIVFVEPFGSSGNIYLYIKDEDESRNPYKTTLEGTVKEFSYKDLRITSEVEVE